MAVNWSELGWKGFEEPDLTRRGEHRSCSHRPIQDTATGRHIRPCFWLTADERKPESNAESIGGPLRVTAARRSRAAAGST